MVADEVRGLAGKTYESTNQVRGIVNAIQTQIKVAVENIEAGSQSAQRCVAAVQHGSDNFNNIQRVMKDISEVSDEITGAITVQTEMITSVIRTMLEMDVLNSGALDFCENTVISGDDLRALSAKLISLVGNFTLTDQNFSATLRSKPRVREDNNSSVNNDDDILF